MNYVRFIVLLTFISSIILLNSAHTKTPGEGTYILEVRTGNHSDFRRIVFQGTEAIISKGVVNQKGKEIMVRFSDMHFKVKKTDTEIASSVDKDAVTLFLKDDAMLKTFFLKEPSRLVIDVYPQADRKKQEEERRSPPESKKNEQAVQQKAAEISGGSSLEQKGRKDKDKKATEVNTEAADDTEIHDNAEPNSGTDKIIKDTEHDDVDLIPEKFKAMWTLLESGNFYAVLKEFPAYKPADFGSLASYYYIYAKAHIMAKQYWDAVKYLRLAYIYATGDDMKQQALIQRAGMYRKIGFVYEARADYIVFLRDYPSSPYIEEAHWGLAESLSGIGLFHEAVKHYRKAGPRPEVLFAMGNALQKLGEVGEAGKVYARAMLADKTYPRSSHETYYLMSENMRMSGDLIGAKRQLSFIDSGPYQDNASISLGLIAMNESDTREAVRKFMSASRSRDHTVKVQALFHLSLAHIKEGKFNEAASYLEQIRHNHIDSKMYKDTLLVLSKLYKKQGKVKESVSLLKELVYGKQPPGEAFAELEAIVLDTQEHSSQEELSLVPLWREVGQWLIDETREEFLFKVAKRLRFEGKPFMDLCLWLVNNASQQGRGKAAIDLADYYIGIGNGEMSRHYIDIAKKIMEPGDGMSRVEAKILRAQGEQMAALKKIMTIKEIIKTDLDMMGSIIYGINTPESQDVREAIAFYEKILNGSDWDAENYAMLADILYANNGRSKALKYYRIAHNKNPDDEWATYRVGRNTVMPESGDMFRRLQEEENLFGRLAKSKLMEIALVNKVKEVY